MLVAQGFTQWCNWQGIPPLPENLACTPPLPTLKNYFQLHKPRSSFVRPQSIQIFQLLLYPVWERSKVSQFNYNTLPKIFFAYKFQIYIFLPYVKRVFLSLLKLLNSSLRTKIFKKIYFAIEILDRCLLTVKKYFKLYRLRSSLDRPQNIQIFQLLLYSVS